MSEMRTTPVATTRKRALATSTNLLKSCGSLAFLLLFLLAFVANAHAATTVTMGSLPGSVTYGTSVTIKATLTNPVAGSLTFQYSSTSASGSYTALTGGTCNAVSITTLSTTAISCSIAAAALPVSSTLFFEAKFTSGAGTVVTSGATAVYAVTKATPVVTLGSSASSSIVYGTPVTLTVGGLAAGASGTVAFTYGTSSTASNDTTAVTCSNAGATTVTAGAASCITTLPAGSDEVVATVTPAGGTTDYTALTFANTTPTAVTVTAAPLSTTLTAALSSASTTPINAANSSASLILTATTTPTAAAAGSVTFTDTTTSTTLCNAVATGSPSAGVATCSTSALTTGGNHTLSAAFTPNPSLALDFTGAPSNGTDILNVVPTPTLVIATPSTMQCNSGAAYCYGATLTLSITGLPTAIDAHVVFKDGANPITGNTASSTVSVNSSGAASFSTSTLASPLTLGSHSFTAAYSGDSTYPGSTSNTVSGPIASTATAVAEAAKDSQSNPLTTWIAGSAAFTLTATVTSSSTEGSFAIPSGSVTFYDSSTQIGKVTITANTGVVSLASSAFASSSTTLAPGKHRYIASYGGVYSGGTAEYSTSISTSAPVTITGSSQTITFNPALSGTYGGSATLSATATSNLAVTFTASGACSVSSHTLSYTSAGVCTVNANQAGSASWAAATQVQKTVTVNPAPLTVTASSLTGLNAITYGTAVPTITASYSGFIGSDTKWTGLTTRPTCTTTYTNTSAPTSYPTSCLGAAGANYTINPVSGSITVNKASQTFSHWYNSTTTYRSPVALSAIASSGLTVSYSVSSGPGSISNGNTLTPTAASAAGTVIVVAANQSGNANYLAATQVTKTVTVYPASLLITAASPAQIVYGTAVPTINAANAIYTGFMLPDTRTSLSTQPTCITTYTNTSHPNAYSTTCYGAVDPNYDITYFGGSFTVIQATPIPNTWPTAGGITYGAALSTSHLSGGSSTSLGSTFAWTNTALVPGAGTDSESVTFSPTDSTDYTTALGSVSIVVAKATSTISSSPTSSAITFGSALSASKLSGGSGSTAGSFSWTTSSTIPPALGPNTENVTFTPTDTRDYTTASGTASVTVTKGTPTVSNWPTATSIPYGDTLASSNLSFTSGSGGTFAWTNTSTAPNAGTSAQSVTFTPGNTTDYSTVTHNINVTVTKQAATVTWPSASAITYGQVLSYSNLTGGSSLDENSNSLGTNFTWTYGNIEPGAGTPLESVTFTPSNPNYSTTTHNLAVTVNQATATSITWPTASSIPLGETLDNSILSGGASTPDGNFAWADNTVQPGVGVSQYSVVFTPDDPADYSTANQLVNIVVNPCGKQDSLNSDFATALNVFNDNNSVVPSFPLDAEGGNVSALCAVNSGPDDTAVSVTVAQPFITSGAISSSQTDSSTYGTNSAVLAFGTTPVTGQGATIAISDDGFGDPGTISTSTANSNGVFASMGGTVTITDNIVSTSGNNSHAFDATYGGTLTINNSAATTAGNSSSVIVAGIGGGTVSVNGGVYASNGTRSAGIRVAGTGTGISPFSTVSVSDVAAGTTIMAQDSDAVVIEGGNSVSITSTGNGISLSGALGDDHGIFLYQSSTLTDATAGTGTFTMVGGSITYTCDETTSNNNNCTAGTPASDQNLLPTLFSVANTTAAITLTDVTVTNDTLTDSNINGTLLTVAALSSNGGSVTFDALGETLIGDVIVDGTSTANLSLAADTQSNPNPSSLTGAINAANSAETVNLTLDATSSWVVANGNSYLTSLNNNGTPNGINNISCQNYGQCFVYVGGNSSPLAGIE